VLIFLPKISSINRKKTMRAASAYASLQITITGARAKRHHHAVLGNLSMIVKTKVTMPTHYKKSIKYHDTFLAQHQYQYH